MYIENNNAKNEIMNRRDVDGLREAIEDFIGVGIPPHLANCQIRGVLARSVATPNEESAAFITAAQEAGLEPLWVEYHADKFSTRNTDKVALAKMPFDMGTGRNGGKQVRKKRIIDFGSTEGRPINSIKTVHGEPLIELHHRMFKQRFGELDRWEASEWLTRAGGSASAYYERYLALFIVHGVLFEHFPTHGEEKRFTEKVVFPALERLENRFGVTPLVVPFLGEGKVYDDHWNEYPGELMPLIDS